MRWRPGLILTTMFENVQIVLIQRPCYTQAVLRPVKVLTLSPLRVWALCPPALVLSLVSVLARDAVNDG